MKSNYAVAWVCDTAISVKRAVRSRVIVFERMGFLIKATGLFDVDFRMIDLCRPESCFGRGRRIDYTLIGRCNGVEIPGIE